MKHLSNLNSNWTVMFLLFILLTGGCSVTVHKPLDFDLPNHTYNTRVLSTIHKEEISIHIDEKQYTSAGGGGLLWVLIDKGINKARGRAAEERVAPLLEATANVDFRTQYWDTLEKALFDSPWLKVKHLDKYKLTYTQEEIAEMKPLFLILNTSYELSPNCQVLIVQTKAEFYLNNLNIPNKRDYFGFHTYYSGKVGKNDEKDEKAIELWAANNASAYREALAEGIEQNMYMLRLDLLDNPANPKNEKGEKVKLHIRSPISGSMQTLQGKELNRSENRVVMREKGGNLFSIGLGLEE